MDSKCLPLSVVFLTFNSEAYIETSLRSVVTWAGEIFVVDSGSKDATLEIVRRYTDRVVYHPFQNYAQQRNWAQENLRLSFEWVFHLDADEQATPELRESLISLFAGGGPEDVDGFLVARRVVFMGRWIRHGGMYPVYHHRIFRRGKGRCEERLYDQHFIVYGNTKIISGDLIDLVTTDIDTWTQRHIRWAGLEVAEQFNISNQQNELRVSPKLMGSPIERKRWARTSVYYHLPLFFRALGYFLYRYFLRLGFLDGPQGLIFHVLQGFWYRFYVDAKIWEMRYQAQQSQSGNPGPSEG